MLKSKFQRIQAAIKVQRQNIDACQVVWSRGPLSPSEGSIAVAIAIPPPLIPHDQEEATTSEPAILKIPKQQRQQPKMKITDRRRGTDQTFELRVGDILRFDAHETLATEAEGVGLMLILMRYKVTRTPGPER